MARKLLLGVTMALATSAQAAPPDVTRVAIPADTRRISVDGVTLQLKPLSDIARFGRPALYVPRGRHLIRVGQQTAYRAYLSKQSYWNGYRQRREKTASQGAAGRRQLLTLLARSFDHPETAEPLHLLGNHHHRSGSKQAAAKLYRRAIALNPAYAPSHLNLAFCLLEASDKRAGLRELLLAKAFNLSDVFGIEELIGQLASKHGLTLTGATATLLATNYIYGAQPKLTELDRRFIRFYTGVGRYIPRPDERAKALSNLGLYFQRKNKPQLAHNYFGQALSTLSSAGQNAKTFKIAAVIFTNIARTLGSGRIAEDYRVMAKICESLR